MNLESLEAIEEAVKLARTIVELLSRNIEGDSDVVLGMKQSILMTAFDTICLMHGADPVEEKFKVALIGGEIEENVEKLEKAIKKGVRE